MFNASSQVQRWQPGVVDEQATSVLVSTDRVTLAFPSLIRLASDGDRQGPSSATACPDNPGGGGGLCPERPLSTRAPQSLSLGSPIPAQVVPNGVVGIAGAGQAAGWAVQALGAQALLAAWAFVAGFTRAGAGAGGALTSVVAVTALGALEAEGPQGAFLLAPAGQQSTVSPSPGPALPGPSSTHPPAPGPGPGVLLILTPSSPLPFPPAGSVLWFPLPVHSPLQAGSPQSEFTLS